jgi:mono/diheme cytochrome c family protein
VRPAVFPLLVPIVMFGACGDKPARGQQLYAQQGCAVCHGADARGDGPSVRRLDVPPRDLTDPRAYRNGATADRIATSIRTGAGAMPAYRELSEEEAAAIADWIVSRQRAR